MAREGTHQQVGQPGDSFETPVFSVVDKRTDEEFHIDLRRWAGRVNLVDVYQDRLVVSGGGTYGDIVHVVDIAARKVIDTIRCLAPTLSQTKRYVLFQRWLPRMPAREQRSVLWLLYDLEQTPEQNRVDETSKGLKTSGTAPTDSGYSTMITNVGFPIYPEENVENQHYEIRGMHFTPDYPTSCGWPVRLPRRCWTISE